MSWEETLKEGGNLDSWFKQTQRWVDTIDYSIYEKGIVEIVSKIRKLLLKAKKSPYLRQEIKEQILEIASKRKFKNLDSRVEQTGQEIYSATIIPTKYNEDWQSRLEI